MSEQIITEQHLKRLKRQAKLRSRADKSKSYMQHLDVVCEEALGLQRFQDAKALAGSESRQPISPLSLYLQACQDAYFEL